MPAVTRAIANALAPQAIFVFGSVARGTAGANSDVDLMVIDDFERKGRDRMTTLGLAYEALAGIRIPVDLLVVTPAEYAQWKDSRFNVIGVCAQQGRVVYGRV